MNKESQIPDPPTLVTASRLHAKSSKFQGHKLKRITHIPHDVDASQRDCGCASNQGMLHFHNRFFLNFDTSCSLRSEGKVLESLDNTSGTIRTSFSSVLKNNYMDMSNLVKSSWHTPSPSLTPQCQLNCPTYPKWFVESKAPAQSLHFLASRANQSSRRNGPNKG